MLAKFIALFLHEILAEYRKLDADTECHRPHADDPPEQLPSQTSAETQIDGRRWDHDTRHPVTAVKFGFRPPG
jgi:hypothetical protein